jgi:hypothetical protein
MHGFFIAANADELNGLTILEIQLVIVHGTYCSLPPKIGLIIPEIGAPNQIARFDQG